jgi:predicted anti-sigma-YlaC factor YlaD
MTCAEFIRDLYGDSSDLAACEAHLLVCPKCALVYSDDLKLEKTLQQLPLSVHPVDISHNVMATIKGRQQLTLKLSMAQKAIWILTSLAALVIAFVAVPHLADLFATTMASQINTGSTIALSNIEKIEAAFGLFISSINWQILCLIIAVFAASLIVLLQTGKDSEYFRLG